MIRIQVQRNTGIYIMQQKTGKGEEGIAAGEKKKIKNEGSAEVKKIWGRDKGENPIIHGRRCEN